MSFSAAKQGLAAAATSVASSGLSFTQTSPYTWLHHAAPGPSSGTLAGRLIAVKENISHKPSPTACSSLILEGYHSPFDATCVQALTSAGAHIVGKTKMDEFGMGSQTAHLPPTYGPVYNPSGPVKDSPRSAGGSSGGSAAAVADGSCWAAIGTDTGGSIRLPASYCGVVGLKPSYGLISRNGVTAYADSLDCVGVMAKSVADVNQVFAVLSRPDHNDMTCATTESRLKATEILASQSDGPSLSGLRIGLPLQTHLEAPNVQLSTALLKYLKSLGATIQPVDMPTLRYALPAYYVLAGAEAASNLGRFGNGWFGSRRESEACPGESGQARRRRLRTEGFGPEVRKRILAGTYSLTADAFNNSYLKALRLKRLIRQEFASIFRIPHPLTGAAAPINGVDVLLHPTATSSAPIIGVGTQSEYLQDVLTVPASLAGLPAISVPAGLGIDGWPVGVSLVSQWGMEDVIFRAGCAVEKWSADGAAV